MTTEQTPLALLAIDKAKGLHHLHGLVTKANSDDADPATSTDPNPESQATLEGNPDNNKPLTAEEETYKKRYFDLKNHHDQLVPTLRQELADAKKAGTKPLEIPKTPEELEVLRRKYPETYDMFLSIVRMENQNRNTATDSELDLIRQERAQLQAERNADKILKAHPDAKQITESADFAQWFSEQPKGIQNLLQSPDPLDAIKGLELYKQEKGIKGSAASRVKTGSKATPDTEKKVWYESEVQALSDRDYARFEAEIMAAHREGRLRKG